MSRRRITLGPDEDRLLDAAVGETGASRAELIRRAIRAVYDRPSVEARLAALAPSNEIWSETAEDGEQYVDRIRIDFNTRLKALGRD